jgi:hypothetical protein
MDTGNGPSLHRYLFQIFLVVQFVSAVIPEVSILLVDIGLHNFVPTPNIFIFITYWITRKSGYILVRIKRIQS